MRNAPLLALVAALAIGGATAPDKGAAGAAAPAAKPAAACAPPPKDLVVKDLEVGKGVEAIYRSAVLVGYTGWVYDGCKADLKGEQFDSSEGRRTPFGLMIGAGKVIKGWDEGLVGMREGGKRLLVIPPDKAYGARSPTPKIPPDSTLVFEVTLVKHVGGEAGKPALK